MREARERAFHNRIFADNSRTVVSKFYAITGRSDQYYHQMLLSVGAGKRALEIGCGDEAYASFVLGRQGVHVTGMDISEVAVNMARKKYAAADLPIEFVVGNAETLNFPDDTFDLVCGTGVLHHLELKTVFAEICRVLKPDGMAVFLEPLGHNPIVNLYRRLTPQLRTEDEHPLVMRDLALLKRYFDVARLRYFSFSTLFLIPLRRLPGFTTLVRGFNAFDQAIFRVLPFLRRYAWITVLVFAQPHKTT